MENPFKTKKSKVVFAPSKPRNIDKRKIFPLEIIHEEKIFKPNESPMEILNEQKVVKRADLKLLSEGTGKMHKAA